MKSLLIAGAAAGILLVGGAWWAAETPTSSEQTVLPDSGVVSRSGLHWHPQLEIYINGEKQEIPSDIGVGIQYASMPTYDPRMRMTALHTHDDLPIIHMEFGGVVRENDTRLGNFFQIWGQEFSANQIFERENGPEGTVSMLVNGVPNNEFEHYRMKDGDRIEIRYE